MTQQPGLPAGVVFPITEVAAHIDRGVVCAGGEIDNGAGQLEYRTGRGHR